ncbi:hypothetical protein IHE44_0006531 [Lamprotornis superbus]|uniref:Secreted protein n=1 Tax=Lamprotornis superbus TaxID=245042 RepID=A0A835NII3_9PASS|nr:hypothetical protein IHE44_0006531 [Lamprotornis superbus]
MMLLMVCLSTMMTAIWMKRFVVSLGKGAMPRGLVLEQWDLALLPHGCYHSSEDPKDISAPCEAFPALHLSPLMKMSVHLPAKQGGPSEP